MKCNRCGNSPCVCDDLRIPDPVAETVRVKPAEQGRSTMTEKGKSCMDCGNKSCVAHLKEIVCVCWKPIPVDDFHTPDPIAETVRVPNPAEPAVQVETGKTEKELRIEYQGILYDLCNLLDTWEWTDTPVGVKRCWTTIGDIVPRVKLLLSGQRIAERKPEPAGEPDWETCTQCGGLGKIPNNPHSLAIDCNKCFGIGKVDRRIALSKLLKEPPKQLAENPKWDTATINEFVDRVFKLGAYIHGADVAEILVSVADKMKEETNGT